MSRVRKVIFCLAAGMAVFSAHAHKLPALPPLSLRVPNQATVADGGANARPRRWHFFAGTADDDAGGMHERL